MNYIGLLFSRVNTDWLWDNYPPDQRFASLIFVSEDEDGDVLKPEVLQAMYRIRKGVENITSKHGQTWSDICIQVPVVKPPDVATIFGRKRKKRQTNLDPNSTADVFNFNDFG